MYVAAARTTPELLAALRVLDELLELALVQADGLYGPDAAVDPHRGLYVTRDEAETLLDREPGIPALQLPAARRAPGDVAPRIRQLAEEFGLDAFDEWLVLIAVASDLDLRYERLYGYLQDDVTRRRPTVDLALTLLCATAEEKLRARRRIGADAPLVRERLLELVPDPHQTRPPLLSHYLAVDEAVVGFLLDDPALDGRLADFCSLTRPPPATLVGTLGRLTAPARSGEPLRLLFEGAAVDAKNEAAAAVAGHLDIPLLAAVLDEVEAADLRGVVPLVVREARLRGALLYLSAGDADRFTAACAALDELPRLAVLAREHAAAPVPGFTEISFRPPGYLERRARWQVEATELETPVLEGLAARFRLGADEIAAAADAARRRAGARGENPAPADFLAAARAHSGTILAARARKIVPRFGWDDIVLPPDPLAQLHEICVQGAFAHVVYDRWGFDDKLSLGKGLNALFVGPPGTGKTMAAEVIANELGLDLYAIDLSQIVDKYLGETEKNLHRVFEEAQATSAILFFDEADALFGRRSEVKDAHDRYANVEVSYLLQKLEEYDGVVILASNLRQNIDDAFVRRIHHIVDFPFPDEEHRRLIWRGAFPEAAPLDDGVDLGVVARALKLSGGSIRNVSVAAAFAAAADDGPISTSHLELAARREYQKLGQTWTEPSWR